MKTYPGMANASGLVIQPDGKIVIFGRSSYHDSYSDYEVLLIRILDKMGLNALFCLIFSVLLISRHAQGALGNDGILGVFCMLYGVVLVIIGRKARGGKSQRA